MHALLRAVDRVNQFVGLSVRHPAARSSARLAPGRTWIDT